jgi:hypothetical protein
VGAVCATLLFFSSLVQSHPRHSSLTELNIARCVAISGGVMSSCTSSWPQLRSLNVSWTIVSDTHMHVVIKNCAQLQYVNVEGCKQVK